MRAYATFFVISVMTLGLLFLLLTRFRAPYDAPAEVVVVAPPDAGAGEGGASAVAADGGAFATVEAGAGDAGSARERPLRVTALGWELAAPGVALVTGGGPIAASIPALDVEPEDEVDAIAARLARGGDAPGGADVAVLPAPAFVVAYEKLRALDPRAFVVTGFSRGREELRTTPGALLRPAPTTDEVKLVAGAGTSPETRAAGSESATVLGLFVLRSIGVAPSRVRFVAPGTADARSATFAALVRGATDERKPALSTSDAARLVPIVMVAPRAALESREAVLRDLARVWLDAGGKVGRDPAPIARAIADARALPLVGDAGARPDALALVDRMGRVEPTALGEQGAFVLGTAPGSLPSTLGVVWSLAREGGLTTAATPDPLPIDARVVRALGAVPPPAPAPPAEPAADAGAPTFAPAPANAAPLFVVRDPGLAGTARPTKAPSATDLAALAGTSAPELAQVAALFPRSLLRFGTPSGEKNARIFAAAAEAAGVPAARLATSAAPAAGASFVAVEVLVAP